MPLVYITKYSLIKIGGILDIPYERSLSASKAIHTIIASHTKEKIFSSPELKVMTMTLAVNDILNTETADNIKIMNQRKSEFHSRKQRVIFYQDRLTYHYYKDCPNLLSDYNNFTIPVEIPEHRIEEYRQYFINNIDTFNRNEEAYYAQANAFFRVHMSPIKKSHHANSGKESVSSNNLLQSSTDEEDGKYIEEALSFFQTYRKTINKYGYASHLKEKLLQENKMSIEDYKIITAWHILKTNTKSEIISKIIKINQHSEQLFSEEVMIALGFHGCATCKTLNEKSINKALI
ncbi:hypothetical protein [Pantoea sp. App145]|uniref:hypothetical protein n=1 Tax=Pantoea sp. App145 TaxID=3071567 RepID=UPI003A7F7C98